MAERRAAGTGSLRLRKDGRWEGRVITGYDDKGLPITKNVLGKTKEICERKLDALRAEIDANKPQTPVLATDDELEADVSFGRIVARWYEAEAHLRFSPSNLENCAYLISAHILPALGEMTLAEMTPGTLQRFYNNLRTSGRKRYVEKFGAGLSASVVRKCHFICKDALQWAKRSGRVKDNPALLCKVPAKAKREFRMLNQPEMQRLLIQAKAEGCYEMFLLELATGLRRGELLGLQWDDVDLCGGTLRVERQVQLVEGELLISTPKTPTSVRTIVLPPRIVDVLRQYKKDIDSRWVFPSPTKEDSPLLPTTAGKRLKRMLERASCHKVRFHDLRHIFASVVLERGTDVKMVASLLGHATTETTLDVYCHVTEVMERTAAGKLNQLFGNSAGKTGRKRAADSAKTARYVPRFNMRRPGTGCITQLNDHLFEGRYTPTWPDGKRRSCNVYAKTREECERLLEKVIAEQKAQIRELKRKGITDPDLMPGPKPLKREVIHAYMMEHPMETNKGTIARACNVHRKTVEHYYAEIREELKRTHGPIDTPQYYKKDVIKQFMINHPEETQTSVIAQRCGVSRNTVKRNYDTILRELGRA